MRLLNRPAWILAIMLMAPIVNVTPRALAQANAEAPIGLSLELSPDGQIYSVQIDAPLGSWGGLLLSVILDPTALGFDPATKAQLVAEYPWLDSPQTSLSALSSSGLALPPSTVGPEVMHQPLAILKDHYVRCIVPGQSVPVRRYLQPVTLSDAQSQVPGHRIRTWDALCESWTNHQSIGSDLWLKRTACLDDGQATGDSSYFCVEDTLISALQFQAPSLVEFNNFAFSDSLSLAKASGGLSVVFQALIFTDPLLSIDPSSTDTGTPALPSVSGNPPAGPRLRASPAIPVPSIPRLPATAGDGVSAWLGQPYGASAVAGADLALPWSGLSFPISAGITVRGSSYVITGMPTLDWRGVSFTLPSTVAPGNTLRIDYISNAQGVTHSTGTDWRFLIVQ